MFIKNFLSVIVLFLFGFQPALAGWGPNDYTIYKNAGDQEITIEARWGSWTGMIGIEEYMSPAKTHELIFEFQSPNYFSKNTGGHFFVGVRADYTSTPYLQGRGVVIGRVTGYPENPPCSPTSIDQTVAIELFFEGGNCVYGSSTEAVALEDNVRYRLQLASQRYPLHIYNVTETHYKLWKKVENEWVFIGQATVVENVDGPTYMADGHSRVPIVPPLNSMGMFLGEVFSTHSWTMNIYNMVSNTCAYGNKFCTDL